MSKYEGREMANGFWFSKRQLSRSMEIRGPIGLTR